MASVTFCSDFGDKVKSLPWNDGTRCHHLFWMLSFKPAFSLSSFNFFKRLFSSSLSAIKVLSSAYLRWFGHNVGVFCISEVIDIFPGKLDSSLCFIQPAFCMMYSAYKLNRQGDNIQPWRTPFPYLEPVCCSTSSSTCCFLTCIQAQEAGQVVWYSHLLKNFSQFVVIHTAKGFGIVNKAEVNVFSGTLLLF